MVTWPTEMVGAAQRAAAWGAVSAILLALLRQGEENRELHTTRVPRKHSRVSDVALGDVLRIALQHEELELAEVGRWQIVKCPEEPRALPAPKKATARTGRQK